MATLSAATGETDNANENSFTSADSTLLTSHNKRLNNAWWIWITATLCIENLSKDYATG